jgi:ribose/xylose/arabinose/galactoside ABC-type transport system permease subunit
MRNVPLIRPDRLAECDSRSTRRHPCELILWFGVILLVTFILSFTTFGRKIYSTETTP